MKQCGSSLMFDLPVAMLLKWRGIRFYYSWIGTLGTWKFKIIGEKQTNDLSYYDAFSHIYVVDLS